MNEEQLEKQTNRFQEKKIGGKKNDIMEMTLICGYCKKKTSFPKLSKDGKRVKCNHCEKWQTFNGVMNIGKEK